MHDHSLFYTLSLFASILRSCVGWMFISTKFSCEFAHNKRFACIVHFNCAFQQNINRKMVFSFSEGITNFNNNIFCVVPFIFGQKINASAIVCSFERDGERYIKRENRQREWMRWKQDWNQFNSRPKLYEWLLKWTVCFVWQSDNFYREQRKITALRVNTSRWWNEKTNLKIIKTADECRKSKNRCIK